MISWIPLLCRCGQLSKERFGSVFFKSLRSLALSLGKMKVGLSLKRNVGGFFVASLLVSYPISSDKKQGRSPVCIFLISGLLFNYDYSAYTVVKLIL